MTVIPEAAIFSKDPGEVKDFLVDWSVALDDEGDTISTSEFTVPTGLTEDTESNTTTTATVWLSGGTAGTAYEVENKIETVGLRTWVRTILIKIIDK